MSKKQKFILVLALTSILIIFLLLVALSKTTLDYRGFSVDGAGRVYVGKSNRIDVYGRDGAVVHSICPKAISRGYTFAVQQDYLCIATGSHVFKYSLAGEFIEQRLDDTYTYDQFQEHKWKSISEEGDTYRFRFWGKLSIIKNETTTVWEEGTFSAVIRCGFIISAIMWFLSVIYFVASNQHDWWKTCTI